MEDDAGRRSPWLDEPAGVDQDPLRAAGGATRREGQTDADGHPVAFERVPPVAPFAAFDGRSPTVATCPFFRSLAEDGELAAPIESPDPANRCAAFGAPRPQSIRQQQLVCLSAAHINCPRYLRGALVTAEPVRRSIPRGPSAPVAAAALVLLGSVAISFGFVLARGGLDLPVASPQPTRLAVASIQPTAAPTIAPTVAPTPAPTARPTPSPTAVPTPTPSASPPPRPSPAPTSDRYQLLSPCPDAPDCWIYVVRAGDNLASIANYFGVPLETVRDLNPWTETTGLRAGQELRLPPPTR